VLRASGPDFNVDTFVVHSNWHVAKVFHRGEAVRPKIQPDGRKRDRSGVNIVVSEAGLHDFAEQIQDAIKFLIDGAAEIRRLVGFPGVTSVVLDFGIAWRDVAAQSDQFPADLVRLAGACGIALELSHYPVSEGEPAAR